MNLLPVFEWLEATALGAAVRDSLWLFPVIEAVHLIAFAIIGGAVLIVDLRLFGLGLRRQSTPEVAREAQPFLLGSLALMFASGIPLFLTEALKCYYSEPFRVKMIALALAIAFTFTVRQRVVAADQARVGPLWSKLVAALSITLWGTVAWGGRWIGFSG